MQDDKAPDAAPDTPLEGRAGLPVRRDRRTIPGEPRPDVMARVRGGRDAWLEGEILLARDLGEIDRCRSFTCENYASLHEFAVKAGYDGERARLLADVGWALEGLRGVEAGLRGGTLTIPAVALLGFLLRRGVLPRDGEDWLRLAGEMRLRDLRRWMRRRLAEEEQRREALVEVTIFVTPEQKGTLRRAQKLASREAGRMLSFDLTIVRALEHYVEAKDPLLRRPGRRRVGPTALRPESRYVPAEVERALLKRSGDACEVPDCPFEVHVETCHVEPHAEGGDQEEGNLVRLCTRHHAMLDAGRIRVVGFDPDGRPIFERRDSRAPPPRRRPPAGGGEQEAGPWPDRACEPRVPRLRASAQAPARLRGARRPC